MWFRLNASLSPLRARRPRPPGGGALLAVLIAPAATLGALDLRPDGGPVELAAAPATLALPSPPEVLEPRPPTPLATEKGEATYYSDALHGGRTASGALLDQNELVAAHRRYPFGTLLRVTHRANGRSVEVRVIDRGPFAPGKRAPAVVDLSRAAARRIGMLRQGRALVTVDVLEWGDGRRSGDD